VALGKAAGTHFAQKRMSEQIANAVELSIALKEADECLP
jgi:hypothetical protein